MDGEYENDFINCNEDECLLCFEITNNYNIYIFLFL